MCSFFIAKCTVCKSEKECQQCQDGFYVDPDGFCSSCSIIKECLTCLSADKCLACNVTYGIDNITHCSKCEVMIGGCELCHDYKKCEQCVPDFYYPK